MSFNKRINKQIIFTIKKQKNYEKVSICSYRSSSNGIS